MNDQLTEAPLELVRKYVLADHDDRPDILGALVERVDRDNFGSCVKPIAEAICRGAWQGPSADDKRKLADLLFSEHEDLIERALSAIGFKEQYELFIVLYHRLSHPSVYAALFGKKGVGVARKGSMRRTLEEMQIVSLQIRALHEAAMLPGAEVNDLLPFVSSLNLNGHQVKLGRIVTLVDYFLNNHVQVTPQGFKRIIERLLDSVGSPE